MEAWLRGPIEGVPPLLMPVAHALVQAVEDVESAVAPLSADQLWIRPGGIASVGFHLRHIAGVVGRLFTYARGGTLTREHLTTLGVEDEPGNPPVAADDLFRQLQETVERAVEQLRNTAPDELLESREVGRKRIPSNVFGLLFHAAEHAQRQTGQVVATPRLVHGNAPSP